MIAPHLTNRAIAAAKRQRIPREHVRAVVYVDRPGGLDLFTVAHAGAPANSRAEHARTLGLLDVRVLTLAELLDLERDASPRAARDAIPGAPTT